MIQLNTILDISDNSGAKKAKCIKISDDAITGTIGDVVTVALQKVIPHRKVKTGSVVKSLLIGLKKETHRKDGSSLKFDTNRAILLTNKNLPLATRIFGAVPRELRQKKHMKAISIAQGVI